MIKYGNMKRIYKFNYQRIWFKESYKFGTEIRQLLLDCARYIYNVKRTLKKFERRKEIVLLKHKKSKTQKRTNIID